MGWQRAGNDLNPGSRSFYCQIKALIKRLQFRQFASRNVFFINQIVNVTGNKRMSSALHSIFRTYLIIVFNKNEIFSA